MGPNRNNRATERGSLAALVALLVTVGLIAACAPTAPRLDLTKVQACPAEDGPGLTGPVPCVFDSDAPGKHPNGYGNVRWVLYVGGTCPVNVVQDQRLVHCVSRDDWTGGIGSGEGRTN